MAESLARYGQSVKPHMAMAVRYLCRMAKRKETKRVVAPAPARAALSANLKRLMQDHEKRGLPYSASPALADKTKMSTGTIGRIVRGEVAANLDTIAAIAAAYELQPWQILVPDLDPSNPPVAPSNRERELYANIAKAAHELVQKERDGAERSKARA